MNRKYLSLLLALVLTLSLASGVSAAESAADILTKGGLIKLTSDLTLTDDVHITKNTILDLNGYSITGFERVFRHDPALNIAIV